MDNIAFRRAKFTDYKGYFGDDYIVEYYNDARDQATATQGWEMLSEDDFIKEMLKNPGIHKKFIEDQKEYLISIVKSSKDAATKRLQLTVEERLELEKLRKFKRTYTKKKGR